MWKKISDKKKRQFILFSFVYSPIALMLAIVVFGLIIKYVATWIGRGGFIFGIIVAICGCIWTIVKYYAQITKTESKD